VANVLHSHNMMQRLWLVFSLATLEDSRVLDSIQKENRKLKIPSLTLSALLASGGPQAARNTRRVIPVAFR
jgi:hypothetical protein